MILLLGPRFCNGRKHFRKIGINHTQDTSTTNQKIRCLQPTKPTKVTEEVIRFGVFLESIQDGKEAEVQQYLNTTWGVDLPNVNRLPQKIRDLMERGPAHVLKEELAGLAEVELVTQRSADIQQASRFAWKFYDYTRGYVRVQVGSDLQRSPSSDSRRGVRVIQGSDEKAANEKNPSASSTKNTKMFGEL